MHDLGVPNDTFSFGYAEVPIPALVEASLAQTTVMRISP